MRSRGSCRHNRSQTLKVVPAILLTLAVVMVSACGGDGDQIVNGPALDLTGVWIGRGTDSSGPGTMTLDLDQSGNSVSGTFTAVDDATGAEIRGTISGTINGNSFQGQISASFGGCSIEVGFTATVSGDSMSATYSGNNSCTGPVTDGQFNLTRQ